MDEARGSLGAPRREARRLQLRHRAESTELGRIRRCIARWARQNAMPEDAVIDLQLAVGEAVSNGVEHAYAGGADRTPTVDVELEIRPTGPAPVVAVRVVDHGRWRPTPDSPGYRGRGLAMIEKLSHGLHVSSTGRGTQVCFDIPMSPLAL